MAGLSAVHLATADFTVVGAGIVGLSAARNLLSRFPNSTVAVLEACSNAARGQSSHNSGVIHSGVLYQTGSERAFHCVRGARMLYDFLGERNLPHKRNGKLLVARSDDDVAKLHRLKEQGERNGVQGLSILDNEQVRRFEPAVAAPYGALHSANTGVTDFERICQELLDDIKSTGRGRVLYNFQVKGIEGSAGGAVRVVGKEPGQRGPDKVVESGNAVNCAGLYSDTVAMGSGASQEPRIFPFRGRYLRLRPEAEGLVRTNVYPVRSSVPLFSNNPIETSYETICAADRTPPKKAYSEFEDHPALTGMNHFRFSQVSSGGFVGIHWTPSVNSERGDGTIIGPAACLATHKEGYSPERFDWRLVASMLTDRRLRRLLLRRPWKVFKQLRTDLSTNAFIKEARSLVPDVDRGKVMESFSGVRAQILDESGDPYNDFIIERDGNVVHVRNAPSPAATACMSIAQTVTDMFDSNEQQVAVPH